MTCSFAIHHYEDMLERAAELGYAFSTFADHESQPPGRLLLLRHDIDLSLPNCLRFARIEAQQGIRATYFVRVHARLYNPFEYQAYRDLSEIERLGHEIGLHYEPGFASAVGEPPTDMVRREKAVLEAILGHPVVSAAAHLPAKSGMTVTDANIASLGLRYEAYGGQFKDRFRYLSDSNGRWRDGCLCEHLGNDERIIANTHGFWWFEASPVENY